MGAPGCKACVRFSRIFWPCFLQVEITPRIRQNIALPCSVRKPPEIFCLTLTIQGVFESETPPQIPFGQVIIKRHREVRHEAQRFGLILDETVEQIFALARFFPTALAGGRGRRVGLAGAPRHRHGRREVPGPASRRQTRNPPSTDDGEATGQISKGKEPPPQGAP